jgi:hypothetical protein
MAKILFVVVENLRQYRGSPRHQGSVLHLVYEFAQPNKAMQPTASRLILARDLAADEALCGG